MVREQKAARSVLQGVFLKIQKKHLTIQSNQTLFDDKKKHKITFEFHEAHYLELFLQIAESFPMNEYDRNATLMIKNKLNQQLA